MVGWPSPSTRFATGRAGPPESGTRQSRPSPPADPQAINPSLAAVQAEPQRVSERKSEMRLGSPTVLPASGATYQSPAPGFSKREKASHFPSGEMRGSASPSDFAGGVVSRVFSPVAKESCAIDCGSVNVSTIASDLPSGNQSREGNDAKLT